MINHTTFEQRLGYQIGVKLAQEAYSREKTASMQAFKTLGSGLKGVATGQGASVSQAFQAGAGQGFKQTMGQIRSGFAEPWKQMYQTFGARQGVKAVNAANAEHAAAQKAYAAAMKSGDAAAQQAAKATLDAAAKNVGKVGNRYGVGYGSTEKMRALTDTAQRGYIPRTAEGAVNYGQVGTMAAGTALGAGALYGGYNMARSAVGANTPQPQVAPHQYYMNQLSSYFS